FLPDHRPPTVLQQPVYAPGQPRRPEVQALEDQVAGRSRSTIRFRTRFTSLRMKPRSFWTSLRYLFEELGLLPMRCRWAARVMILRSSFARYAMKSRPRRSPRSVAK